MKSNYFAYLIYLRHAVKQKSTCSCNGNTTTITTSSSSNSNKSVSCSCNSNCCCHHCRMLGLLTQSAMKHTREAKPAPRTLCSTDFRTYSVFFVTQNLFFVRIHTIIHTDAFQGAMCCALNECSLPLYDFDRIHGSCIVFVYCEEKGESRKKTTTRRVWVCVFVWIVPWKTDTMLYIGLRCAVRALELGVEPVCCCGRLTHWKLKILVYEQCICWRWLAAFEISKLCYSAVGFIAMAREMKSTVCNHAHCTSALRDLF